MRQEREARFLWPEILPEVVNPEAFALRPLSDRTKSQGREVGRRAEVSKDNVHTIKRPFGRCELEVGASWFRIMARLSNDNVCPWSVARTIVIERNPVEGSEGAGLVFDFG